MLKGLKSLNIIQMYHFRLKWKRYTVCTKWWDSQLFLSGTPTFSSGTLTFCQIGVLNSCFQNPSESSGGSILQYFQPSLSYHLSIFEWPFCKGFTVSYVYDCNFKKSIYSKEIEQNIIIMFHHQSRAITRVPTEIQKHNSMIFHDQQCFFHDYLMHGLQPPLLAASSPR